MIEKKDRITHQLVRNAATGIILMEIAGAVTYVIDGTITSRFIGDTALAANGMAGICFTFFAVISGVFASGVSQICSEQIGKGNVEKSSRVFSMALFVTILTSILIGLVGIVFCDQVAALIGATKDTGELYDYARTYIKGFFIGAPGHILVAVLIPEVQLCGKNKLIAASIGALTIADVIGDLLNVLVFKGGMFGMGVATSISYYVSMLVLLSCFCKNKLFKISFHHMNFSGLLSIFKIGLPRATKRVGNIIRPLIMNRMIILAGGAVAMTAFSVEQNVRYVVESVGVGIGGSIFLLGGMFLGEKDYSMLKSCCKVSLQYILFGVGALSVVYFIAAPYVARIYVPIDAPSYDWSVSILRCHAVSLPFLAYNEFYQNLIQAQKKYTLTHIHTICNKLICIIVLCFLLAPRYGVLGLWLSIPLSEILLVVLITVMKGIKNKIQAHPDGFFSLLDPYDEDAERQLEIHISDTKQLQEQIEVIKTFCQKNQLDAKQLYYIELFIEEITVIVMEKGFADATKRRDIDIRIYIDLEDVIIHTKDNGNPITIMDQIELLEKIQDGDYIGLQMVYKLAQEMKYISTMNINNFIVTLPKGGKKSEKN